MYIGNEILQNPVKNIPTVETQLFQSIGKRANDILSPARSCTHLRSNFKGYRLLPTASISSEALRWSGLFPNRWMDAGLTNGKNKLKPVFYQ